MPCSALADARSGVFFSDAGDRDGCLSGRPRGVLCDVEDRLLAPEAEDGVEGGEEGGEPSGVATNAADDAAAWWLARWLCDDRRAGPLAEEGIIRGRPRLPLLFFCAP